MSNYYSDPTANAAIGAADKEMRMMRKWAKRLKFLHEKGWLLPEEEARARRAFIGIYRRLLQEALGE